MPITLDDETTAALTLFNEYVAADRERTQRVKRVKKAERAKDEAAALVKKLAKGGSSKKRAEAEAAYRAAAERWTALRDGKEPPEPPRDTTVEETAEPESTTDSDTEPTADAEPDTEATADAEPDTEATADAETDTEATADAETTAEPEADAETTAEPEADTKATAEAETVTETESTAESEAVTEPTEDTADTKTEPTAEAGNKSDAGENPPNNVARPTGTSWCSGAQSSDGNNRYSVGQLESRTARSDDSQFARLSHPGGVYPVSEPAQRFNGIHDPFFTAEFDFECRPFTVGPLQDHIDFQPALISIVR